MTNPARIPPKPGVGAAYENPASRLARMICSAAVPLGREPVLRRHCGKNSNAGIARFPGRNGEHLPSGGGARLGGREADWRIPSSWIPCWWSRLFAIV